MLPRRIPAWRGNLISNYWGKQVSYFDSLDANILIGSVWNNIYTSAVNVDAEMHFTKPGAFIWNHAKNQHPFDFLWFSWTQGRLDKKPKRKEISKEFPISNICPSLWMLMNLKKKDTSSSVLQCDCPESLTSSQAGPHHRLRTPRPHIPLLPAPPNWLVLHSCSWTRKGLLVSRHSLQIWHLLCRGWKYEILIYVQ